MNRVFVLVALCGIAMLMSITYAILYGHGWAELEALAGYPWFRMAMVDVYVGFVLVAIWIGFREAHAGLALVYIVALMLLGNLFTCGYVLWALVSSQGNWREFWMGWRASD